ncbi:MAG: cell wall-binding repeat-containing protein, partial [Firmicutes bacterium]|nr:cell wall-binding repeat-containing protein [Bacillota bacterium]
LWGPTALNTSLEIAKWGINNGMNVNNMGFATDSGFADALTGAALCGKLNSVLLLAGDNDTENTSFPSEYKDVIEHGFIFGGPNVIKDHTYEQIVASTE